MASINFLVKQPDNLAEWEEYIKLTVIVAFALFVAPEIISIIGSLFSEIEVLSIIYLVKSTIRIAIIGGLFYATYYFRRNIGGKIVGAILLFFFLIGYGGSLAEEFGAIIANAFDPYSMFDIVIQLLEIYMLIRFCILLFGNFGQDVGTANMAYGGQASTKYDNLEKLKSLYDSGAVSEDEFNAEKNKLLKDRE